MSYIRDVIDYNQVPDVSGNMKAKGLLKEYNVIGRKLPTEAEPVTPLFRMRIFAPDHVVAKSRYSKFEGAKPPFATEFFHVISRRIRRFGII